ncbi:hypothetical protein OJM17_gp026 [uncultured phage cr23_1]|jgi:hypothetical protein|uniref:Uncharacterized protein n=1 Tax=uncultured phage cr23_1 TaxID=2986419 RepID=A0AAE7RXR9_9CAUD|nr:hypothetical protein [uncultured Catenibacterium sp.]YP_010510396.1 hypothetical protein OJM17_gp026 [uncultured phage cr23_1]QWM91456.1 hypothetical protein [uncultured phage cr23_1]UVM99560.1 MAG: hypothetical protein [Bacteriophage sp.]UVX85532.1 MAG: hypothetical protein [Bacteriophage sp.]
MNKIDKETSLQLLKLERENSKEAPEIIQKLLNSVEKAVEADKISYFDFIEDMMKGLEEVSDEDDSSLEKREKVVNDICQKLIDKYETGNKE